MPEHHIDSGNFVLLVDDDEIVRNCLRTILKMAGYSVIVAEDGEEALKEFSKRDDIALVITDAVMPRKNGRVLIDDIKKIRPAIKAIIISGYISDVIDLEQISNEGIDLVSKPIKVDVLLNKIQEVMDRV